MTFASQSFCMWSSKSRSRLLSCSSGVLGALEAGGGAWVELNRAESTTVGLAAVTDARLTLEAVLSVRIIDR